MALKSMRAPNVASEYIFTAILKIRFNSVHAERYRIGDVQVVRNVRYQRLTERLGGHYGIREMSRIVSNAGRARYGRSLYVLPFGASGDTL